MSKTIRAMIAEWNLKQEPCCNCIIKSTLENMWVSVNLPKDFHCAVNEYYFSCPWTNVEFPWAKNAAYLIVGESEVI